jgi:nicotinamidase-related amidase
MVQAWDDIISDTEKEIIRRGGYGQPRPLGNCPAVVIIDAQVNYIGENRPILEQIDRYPSGIGEKAWQALPAIRQLIDASRRNQTRLIFTKVRQPSFGQSEGSQAPGIYANIMRRGDFMSDDNPGQQVVSQLAPQLELGDVIVYKEQPSAFFGTPLASYFVKWGVDTLLLAGGSTSGCVRATALDGASLGLHVAVIEECVFDRIELSHKASLLDIWMKYGDVIHLDKALHYLDSLGPSSPG